MARLVKSKRTRDSTRLPCWTPCATLPLKTTKLPHRRESRPPRSRTFRRYRAHRDTPASRMHATSANRASNTRDDRIRFPCRRSRWITSSAACLTRRRYDIATVNSYIIERADVTRVVNVFPSGAITRNSAAKNWPLSALHEAGRNRRDPHTTAVRENARVMRRAMEPARSFACLIDHCETSAQRGRRHSRGIESVRHGLRGFHSGPKT